MACMSALDRRVPKKRPQSRIVGWFQSCFRGEERPRPLLTVLERVTLAAHQSLMLVEADGRKILIATSPQCSPTFFALEQIDRRDAEAHPACSLHGVPLGGSVC